MAYYPIKVKDCNGKQQGKSQDYWQDVFEILLLFVKKCKQLFYSVLMRHFICGLFRIGYHVKLSNVFIYTLFLIIFLNAKIHVLSLICMISIWPYQYMYHNRFHL